MRLVNVWKRFGGVVAVKDVSFTAFAGEVHALLGENGAGTATTPPKRFQTLTKRNPMHFLPRSLS